MGWLIWSITTLFNRAAASKIAVVQMMLWNLRGLTVDVDTEDGNQIYIRFI